MNPKNLSKSLVLALAVVIVQQVACSYRGYVPSYVSSRSRTAAAPVPSGGERYQHHEETGFVSAASQPLSTFSTDVDTAAYANVRRFLLEGERPPADAVRIEELVNYFDYDVPRPAADETLAITTEVARSPFGGERERLVRIALRAAAPRDFTARARHLVFLIDVSGSMAEPNKLPLLQDSLSSLLDHLAPSDTVALVTYAGSSGIQLEPTPARERERIERAIRGLSAGGSTNGEAGISLAYALASEDPDPRAIRRVILATDGDFNVGLSDDASLIRKIEQERTRGVFLTVLGFGMGNLNDAMMEQLADHGNGSYAYIDSLQEARRVLVQQMNATLVPAAKDAKVQVELNPARVARYRLIGYENRRLENRAFADDRKDAGDMGDGQTVTALYQVELAEAAPNALASGALLTVRARYKRPDAETSREVSASVDDAETVITQASPDMRFATAVAGFGMLLTQSSWAGHFDLEAVDRLARGSV
ncbi:MAG TPA: von Willebrand factor type A domain-containing protein, partial [Polyangiales bacterium]|nr:von Willebrand factor type A domain-containing protein [Polyangiales bacterium]